MTKTTLPLVLIVLIAGIGIGMYLFRTNFTYINDHVLTPSTSMKEEVLTIPDNFPVPTIKLTVIPDSVKGYNLHIETTNFKFTPENVNQKDVLGEGHAHIYVDGVKLTRLYGNWYYIGSLEEGTRAISVSLNANSHAQYMHKGQKIEDKVQVVVATKNTASPSGHID